MAPQPTQQKKSPEEKRKGLRDQLFPGCAGDLWDRHKVKGFTTIPRTLGLIMTLIEQLTERKKGHDVSRTYFELWCRSFDDYLIEISDPESLAFAAGFVSRGRGIRSWEERISALAKLGFVRVAPYGSRKQGYVLLMDPHKVVKQLKAKDNVSHEWWGAYVKRASEIGYELP